MCSPFLGCFVLWHRGGEFGQRGEGRGESTAVCAVNVNWNPGYRRPDLVHSVYQVSVWKSVKKSTGIFVSMVDIEFEGQNWTLLTVAALLMILIGWHKIQSWINQDEITCLFEMHQFWSAELSKRSDHASKRHCHLTGWQCESLILNGDKSSRSEYFIQPTGMYAC